MSNWVKIVGLAVSAILLGAGSGLAYNYYQSFNNVDVKIPNGSSVSIYKDRGGEGAFNIDAETGVIATLQSTQNIKFKNGIYIAKINNSSGIYAETLQKFTVSKLTKRIEIRPGYTETKLGQLLLLERVSAQKAITSKYPSALDKNYIVTNERLFEMGDWYGASLKPKDTNADVLKVILKKNGSAWKVAADPSISIGQPSHPNIPLGVLKGTNDLN